MADTSLGFKFEYLQDSGDGYPTIQHIPYKDSEIITKGDLLNLESGEVDLAATGDTTMLGIALNTGLGVDSTTLMDVIVDPDAVYSVYDPNVRLKGANLDIAGATGNYTIATDSNSDLEVVAPSTASERTFVKISHGSHVDN